MKKFLAPLVLLAFLGGCAGMTLPGPLGAVPLTSNPLAGALRQCAMFAELLTPGVNLSAMAEMARGVGQDNVLGNTPQGAMRNCAGLMDTVAN